VSATGRTSPRSGLSARRHQHERPRLSAAHSRRSGRTEIGSSAGQISPAGSSIVNEHADLRISMYWDNALLSAESDVCPRAQRLDGWCGIKPDEDRRRGRADPALPADCSDPTPSVPSAPGEPRGGAEIGSSSADPLDRPVDNNTHHSHAVSESGPRRAVSFLVSFTHVHRRRSGCTTARSAGKKTSVIGPA